MIQFYSPDIAASGMLPREESLHCIRVLRHHEGDIIHVIDGKGFRYECKIVQADPGCVITKILQAEKLPSHWGASITLAVAPTKNIDRMEWMMEKAVEIGVNRIVPVLCAHSERKVLKEERLRKIAVSAMKQSLKTGLPEVTPLMPLKEFLNEPSDAQKFMGYCNKDYPKLELANTYIPPCQVRLLIGPEGDFSPEEVSEAVIAGYRPVTFGKSRLRTETAAIVALDTIHILRLINNESC